MRHGMHQVLTPPPLPGRVFVESLECSRVRGKKSTLALIVITLGKRLQCGNSVTFLYIELSPLSSSFNKSLFCENYHNKEIRRKDILRSKWYCIGLQKNLDLVAVSAIHILTKFTDNSIRTCPHSFSKDMFVLASWCRDVFTTHSKLLWIQ